MEETNKILFLILYLPLRKPDAFRGMNLILKCIIAHFKECLIKFHNIPVKEEF